MSFKFSLKALAFLTLLFALFNVAQAQSNYNRKKWFYDLPLKLNSKDLIQEIRLREAFTESKNYDTSNISKDLKNPVYSGLIKKPHFLNSQYIDSATIKLYSGYRNEERIHLRKILVLEYYIRNSEALEKLYFEGRDDLEIKSTKSVRLRTQLAKNPNYATGKVFYYSKNPVVLSSIWMIYYDTGEMSLKIISESPDH